MPTSASGWEINPRVATCYHQDFKRFRGCHRELLLSPPVPISVSTVCMIAQQGSVNGSMVSATRAQEMVGWG